MKFSIIITGFNQAKTIISAVESAINQHYDNVEVIYVDDASTDNSVQLLIERFGNKLKIIQHDTNQGPLISRLDGIDNSSGDYILFLDGDDKLYLNACSTLYHTISTSKFDLDIIGFGTEIIYTAEVDPNIKKGSETLLSTPCLGLKTGNELSYSTFIDKEISHVVWNKCYSSSLSRQLTYTVERDRLMLNEDFYFTFVSCSLCNNYFGIPNKLYKYSFGQGISTSARLTFPAYQRALTAYKANIYCTEFAKSRGLYNEYYPAIERNRIDGLLSTYIKLSRLPEKDKQFASEMMFSTYTEKYVVSTLAEYYWWNSFSVAEQLNVDRLFPVNRNSIKTLAIYYHRLYNGGVERVISLLSYILSSIGYNIIVITDEQPNENDFPLADGTKRVVLSGKVPSNGENYAERFDKFTSCINENNIDAVIYNAWISPNLFWDMCAIKSTGAAFIIHCHNIFICGLDCGWLGVQHMHAAFRHADSICVLTESDRLYWQHINPNIYLIQNPFTLPYHEYIPNKDIRSNILWLARFAPEKNPMDAIYIAKQVVDFLPNATLYMVGDIPDNERSQYLQLIKSLGIEKNIVLAGYTLDVQKYYQLADVMLITSNYEGFPMTIAESFANNLPIVSYELPYLTLYKNHDAVIQVPWKDTEAAANKIIELFNDSERLEQMRIAAGKTFHDHNNYNYRDTWREILNNTLNHKEQNSFNISREEFNNFVLTVDLAIKQMANKIALSSETDIIEERRRIYSSRRYKIGKAFLYIPSKINTFFRLCKENGLNYTLKYAISKLRGAQDISGKNVYK